MECDHSTKNTVLRKVGWRLIPFMGVLYLLAFLDRVNVGFAALTMNADLRFSATVFGTGAGIFFVGYVLSGVPSNLMLHRFGARRWIALIMILSEAGERRIFGWVNPTRRCCHDRRSVGDLNRVTLRF